MTRKIQSAVEKQSIFDAYKFEGGEVSAKRIIRAAATIGVAGSYRKAIPEFVHPVPSRSHSGFPEGIRLEGPETGHFLDPGYWLLVGRSGHYLVVSPDDFGAYFDLVEMVEE